MALQGNLFWVEKHNFQFWGCRTSFSGEPPFRYAQSGYERTAFSGSTVPFEASLELRWERPGGKAENIKTNLFLKDPSVTLGTLAAPFAAR